MVALVKVWMMVSSFSCLGEMFSESLRSSGILALIFANSFIDLLMIQCPISDIMPAFSAIGIKVLGLSVVTDMGLPDAMRPVNLAEILSIAAKAEPKLTALVQEVVKRL